MIIFDMQRWAEFSDLYFVHFMVISAAIIVLLYSIFLNDMKEDRMFIVAAFSIFSWGFSIIAFLMLPAAILTVLIAVGFFVLYFIGSKIRSVKK
jgi:hypothetical protein